MKTCKKCNKSKELLEFHLVKGGIHAMKGGDGHRHTCKECINNKHRQTYSENRQDPLYLSKYRKHKRIYNKTHKRGNKYVSKVEDVIRHNLKYPEKAKARTALTNSQKGITFNSKEFDRHHWSYKKEYWLDYIILTKANHKRLHCFLIYDQEHMMYRNTKGDLLDTKEKHLKYFETIKHLD